MFEFEGTITTTQICKKLLDEYGERATMDYATTKIISTMRELGGIGSSVGKQTRVKIKVTNPEIITFMTKAAMHLGGSSYYTFSALADSHSCSRLNITPPRKDSRGTRVL